MATWTRECALWGLVTALGLSGCGSGGGTTHVELSGASPAEGSTRAAAAVCHRKVACGSVQLSCGAGVGTAMQCSATIVHADYDRCFQDAQPDLEHLLACAAITGDSVETIETCVDALANQACVTQEQADEAARGAEMNVSLPPDPDPPECEFLKWWSDCESPQ